MMALNRFAKEARLVVQDATTIARDLGASTVEAEHLLLAAAGREHNPAARALHEAGLDYDGLAAALAAETVRSLAAVGVTADVLSFSPFVSAPRFGTSAKLAMERSLRVALARGDRTMETGHLVLAVLRATAGTVPRALECAGVDRANLTARVEAAL
jgi:ATP-dependent Clp protease ATP-binding subunit ClpA